MADSVASETIEVECLVIRNADAQAVWEITGHSRDSVADAIRVAGRRADMMGLIHRVTVDGDPVWASDERSKKATRCKHNARHWFAYYGYVSSSSPTCRHCGEPNPRYDSGRDPFG